MPIHNAAIANIFHHLADLLEIAGANRFRIRGLQRRDLFITNIVKCRPPDNRNPKKHEIVICTSHYLLKQIELVAPKLIVLLGRGATQTLLKVASIQEARGRVLERDNRKYLVGYHPASMFYRQD